MKTALRIAALALALATPLAAVALAPVQPFSATYEVRRNGDVLGEATFSLARDGANWRFSAATRGTAGMARIAGVRIDEVSYFRYVDGRPETLRYRFDQKTSFNSRQRSADVDAAAGRVALVNKGERVDVPFVAGVVDRQLLTVALMQAVAAGRRGEQTLQVLGRRDIEAQVWDIEAKEQVEGLGLAWRLERERDTPDGRSTVIWLDDDAGHLPLRIEQREDDGEVIDMRMIRRG